MRVIVMLVLSDPAGSVPRFLCVKRDVKNSNVKLRMTFTVKTVECAGQERVIQMLHSEWLLGCAILFSFFVCDVNMCLQFEYGKWTALCATDFDYVSHERRKIFIVFLSETRNVWFLFGVCVSVIFML